MIFNMKTKNTSLFLFALLIMSCTQKIKEERNEEIVADSSEVVVNNEHNAKNSLDYIGMYQGVVPCADCEGIETTLVLEDDKNYVLKTNYLGKKKNSTNEFRGVYSWNEAGNTIILSGILNAPNQYFVGENYLKQLDMDGNKIEGDLAERYVLQKKSDSGEMFPPSPLEKVSDERLQFIKWKLVELNRVKITNDKNKPMFIHLIKDNQFTAFAGCNNMMGNYVMKTSYSLSFSPVASTMMACPNMDLEQKFAAMLEKVDSYTILEDELQLVKGKMVPLARFKAIK